MTLFLLLPSSRLLALSSFASGPHSLLAWWKKAINGEKYKLCGLLRLSTGGSPPVGSKGVDPSRSNSRHVQLWRCSVDLLREKCESVHAEIARCAMTAQHA